MKKTSHNKVLTAIAATIALNGIGFAAAAETAETVSWDHENIQMDTRPISQKLKDYRTNNAYNGAANNALKLEVQNNLTSNITFDTANYNRYIVFWDAHLNPNMTYQIVKGFDGQTDKQGFTFENAASPYLNHNMKHIIDCRTETLAQNPSFNDTFLKFKAVRGCAMERTKAEFEAYEQERTKSSRYFLGHNTTLETQINHYQNADDNDPLKSAINSYATQLIKQEVTSSMYASSFITMWHAAITPNVTFDAFKNIDNDKGDMPEFSLDDPSEAIIDNNMQAFFKCRDKTLPIPVPTDIETRHQLVIDVLDCSVKETANDKRLVEEKKRKQAKYFMGLSAPLAQKIQYFNDTDDTQIWNKAVRKGADALYGNNNTSTMFYTSFITLWHTAITPEITFADIKDTKNNGDSGGVEFLWDAPHDNIIDNNVKSVFACRDKILPAIMPTEIEARHQLAQGVIECSIDATQNDYDDFKASLTYVDGDTRPLPERSTMFSANADYKKAVQTGLASHKAIASMTVDAHFKFLETLVNPKMSFNDLKDFKEDDGAGTEFHKYSVESAYIDNNTDIVFECRDKFSTLPTPKTAEARQTRMQEVVNCAAENTQKQFKKYEDNVVKITSDPAYGEDTDYNKWLWAEQAMTDTGISAEKLQNAGLAAETSFSSNLTENFNHILTCRDNAENKGDYTAIKTCATSKAQNDESQDYSQIFKIVGGIAGGGALLGGGLVGMNSYRRRKSQQKHRNRALEN